MSPARLATFADAGRILEIYTPIVRDTAISFELEPPSLMEMQLRIENTLAALPWLVWDLDGALMGYAYGSRHRERAAYQWCVDVSVYVSGEMRREGVGRSLYTALLGILRELGYYTAFAGIALPNLPSVRFHEAVGFRPVGVFPNAGFKLGRWHSVGWWGHVLRAHKGDPEPPRLLPELEPAVLRGRLAGKPGSRG